MILQYAHNTTNRKPGLFTQLYHFSDINLCHGMKCTGITFEFDISHKMMGMFLKGKSFLVTLK